MKKPYRSTTIFECWVCGGLTNQVIIGGMHGGSERTICPQSHLLWHHKLEAKLELLFQPHPKSYREELADEIIQLRIQHRDEIKNDLEGSCDLAERKEIDCVHSDKPGDDGINTKLKEMSDPRNEGLEILKQRTHVRTRYL